MAPTRRLSNIGRREMHDMDAPDPNDAALNSSMKRLDMRDAEREDRIRLLWMALRDEENGRKAGELLNEMDPGFGGPIHMAYRALHGSFKMFHYQDRLMARLKFLAGMSPFMTTETKAEAVALFGNFPDAMPPEEYSFFSRRAAPTPEQGRELSLTKLQEKIDRKSAWAAACSAFLEKISMSLLFSAIVMDALRRHFDLTRNETELWTDDTRSILAADSLTGNVLRAILTLEKDMPDYSLNEAEALILSVYGLR